MTGLPECSKVIEHSCVGHYSTIDLWGPTGTGLYVLLGLMVGLGAARWIGVRGWRDWSIIWFALLAIGAFAHLKGAVGSNWLMAESIPGLYVCAWGIIRRNLPEGESKQ